MSKNKKIIIEILLVILIFIIVIIINNNYYVSKNYTVICYFKPVYENYEETLTFKYNNNSMIDFKRVENIYETTSGDNIRSVDELYTYFNNLKEEYETNDNYTYEVLKSNDHVVVTTYIDVVNYEDSIDNYFESLYITHTLKPNELKKSLEATNYTCEVENE